jgi:hypothetical protein
VAVVIPLNNFPGPADDTVTAQTYYRIQDTESACQQRVEHHCQSVDDAGSSPRRLCLDVCHFPGHNPPLLEAQGLHVLREMRCGNSGSSTALSSSACPGARPRRGLAHHKVLIDQHPCLVEAPLITMNLRHASSNSARLIAPLLKMCSLGVLCLVLSSNTNIAPTCICSRDLSTTTVRLPRGRQGTVSLVETRVPRVHDV